MSLRATVTTQLAGGLTAPLSQSCHMSQFNENISAYAIWTDSNESIDLRT
jgi:hypothetical protein